MSSRLRLVSALVAAALVGTGCAAIGASGGCDGTQIIGIFRQVGDLVENANVQSDDVVIGSIQQIELDGWNARVTMCIDESEKLTQDARLVVRTTSLLGEKFVDFQSESDSGPYLEDGDIVDLDQTSKATELEEVFAKLASVLGTGNLEQINRFTTAQARILENNEDDLREVLSRLRRFTGLLSDRREQIASSVDNLDDVAQTVAGDQSVLTQFLDSFADSSRVLNNQREGLESLLLSLDRFTRVSVRLLDETETNLNRQFEDLRPVLRTLVLNAQNVREALQTLATFSEWFPETMPGDYLQLDVCQADPEDYGPGLTCPQSIENDDPNVGRSNAAPVRDETPAPDGSLELILRRPLGDTT